MPNLPVYEIGMPGSGYPFTTLGGAVAQCVIDTGGYPYALTSPVVFKIHKGSYSENVSFNQLATSALNTITICSAGDGEVIMSAPDVITNSTIIFTSLPYTEIYALTIDGTLTDVSYNAGQIYFQLGNPQGSIHDCKFINGGCFNSYYGSNTGRFYNNKMYGQQGKAIGDKRGTAIRCATWLVYNNYIQDYASAVYQSLGSLPGDFSRIYSNFAYRCTTAFSGANNASDNPMYYYNNIVFECNVGINLFAGSNYNFFYSNTLYNCQSVGISNTYLDNTHNTVINNAVIQFGNNPCVSIDPQNLQADHYNVMDYNLYYNFVDGLLFNVSTAYPGIHYYDLASWQTATGGWDLHSVFARPMYSTPTPSNNPTDFIPTYVSPLKGFGKNINPLFGTDYFMYTRENDGVTGWDVGACNVAQQVLTGMPYSVRLGLDDLPESKYSNNEDLSQQVTGNNKVFTPQHRPIVLGSETIVSDWGILSFPFDYSIENSDGTITLNNAPLLSLRASYNWYDFDDTAILDFIADGLQHIGYRSSPTADPLQDLLNVPANLQTAVEHYALFHGFSTLATKTARLFNATAGKKSVNKDNITKKYTDLAEYHHDMGDKSRDDFYKRFGSRNAPAFGFTETRYPPYNPRR